MTDAIVYSFAIGILLVCCLAGLILWADNKEFERKNKRHDKAPH